MSSYGNNNQRGSSSYGGYGGGGGGMNNNNNGGGGRYSGGGGNHGGGGRYNGGGQGGGGGRSGGGRGGSGSGRPKSSGNFWSNQRQELERNGIYVQTNCYEIIKVNNNNNSNNSNIMDDNSFIYQYSIQIDPLILKYEYKSNDTTTTTTTSLTGGGSDSQSSNTIDTKNIDPTKKDIVDVTTTTSSGTTNSNNSPSKSHNGTRVRYLIKGRNKKALFVDDPNNIISDHNIINTNTSNNNNNNKMNRSTDLTRRILKYCQQQLFEKSRQYVIHDGTNIAYSKTKLEPVAELNDIIQTPEYRRHQKDDDDDNDDAMKQYGNSTSNNNNNNQKTNTNDNVQPGVVTKKMKKEEKTIEYIVSIFFDTDNDDSTSTAIPRRGWYLVSFTHTNNISMKNITSSSLSLSILPYINCMNTALKSNMIEHCIGFGKSPNMFYFHPPHQQLPILPHVLQQKLYNSIMPLLGLKQSIRYCSDENTSNNSTMYNMLLIADFGIRYAYNEENTKKKPPEPYYIFQVDDNHHNYMNPTSAVIANTVSVRNIHNVITDRDKQKEIEKALQQRKFHIKYYKGRKNEEQVLEKQRLHNAKMERLNKIKSMSGNSSSTNDPPLLFKPMTDQRVEKEKYFMKKNTHLFKHYKSANHTDDGPIIIWNPNEYKFLFDPSNNNMFNKKGSSSQAVGKDIKHDRNNFDSSIHDMKSKQESEPMKEGTMMDDQTLKPTISSATGRYVTVAEYFMERYEYTIKYPNMPLIRVPSRHKDIKEYYPIELLLQVQEEVKNSNTEEQIEDALTVYDEYSGLKRIQKITSLLHGNNNNNPLSEFQNGQQKILQTQFQQMIRDQPLQLHAKVLEQPSLLQKDNRVAFITDGSIAVKNFYKPSKIHSFAVINYTNNRADNHMLWDKCFQHLFQSCKFSGMEVGDDINEATFHKIVVQHELPYDLNVMRNHFSEAIHRSRMHFLKERHERIVKDDNGELVLCDVHFCEQDPENTINIYACNIPPSGYKIDISRVDCPSMIYLVLPDKSGSQYYSNIKLLADHDFCIQSQVIAWDKAKRDRNTAYFSNLALKQNLKLSSPSGRETAWRQETNIEMDWLDIDIPTLIIGLSMASASGQNELMTVVGTALLDNTGLTTVQELRAQKKGPLIVESVMVEIIQYLALLYFKYNNGLKPRRVIIYRASGDDGLFEDIIGNELKAVKKAFNDLNHQRKSHHCYSCDQGGCVFCLPKITMIIAQSQHNIVLAPSQDEGVTNVPSGTCVEGLFPSLNLVDDRRMNGLLNQLELKRQQEEENMFQVNGDNGSTAFALIAHGGLKGTSKCVTYRVIWNENRLFLPIPDYPNAKPLLLPDIERLTYHLSFKYGTANKATRFPAVIQYSNRLNTIALGYVQQLLNNVVDEEHKLVMDDDDHVYRRANGDARILRYSYMNRWKGEGTSLPFYPQYMG